MKTKREKAINEMALGTEKNLCYRFKKCKKGCKINTPTLCPYYEDRYEIVEQIIGERWIK